MEWYHHRKTTKSNQVDRLDGRLVLVSAGDLVMGSSPSGICVINYRVGDHLLTVRNIVVGTVVCRSPAPIILLGNGIGISTSSKYRSRREKIKILTRES